MEIDTLITATLTVAKEKFKQASQQILKNNTKSHLSIHKEVNLDINNRNVATLWSSHTHYMFGNLEANLQVTYKLKNFVMEITKYLDSK